MIEALAEHLREHNANVHRGVYALAQEADAAFERRARARGRVHRRRTPQRTIFTKNATEAINLVAYSWGRAQRGRRRRGADHADGAPRQHRARGSCCAASAARSCATWRSTSAASCRCEQLDAELARGDVRLVAFAHVSNVLGTINPVAEIAARARAAGAVSLIDGAQAVPQHAGRRAPRSAPTSTPGPGTRRSARPASACCTDAASCSSAMTPFLTGGDMIASVDFQPRPGTSCRGSSRRARRRSPRPSALGAAVDYLVGARHGQRARARAALTAYMLERLARGAGPARGRAARGGGAAAAWRRSRSRASTRTTWPSWSTAPACASAPAITARSR